jgi:hypothetical protein
MTNFISTYCINPSEINNLFDFDCSKSEDWEELICENEGHFSKEGQFMTFDLGGYDLEVSGRVDYDPGDYWTPEYSDCTITDETIDVTEVTLDDYEIELTKELRDLFSEVIKKNL